MYTTLTPAFTILLLLHASPSATQCDRTFLNDMSAAYLDAQTKGLPDAMPSLSTTLLYTEQSQRIPLNASILTTPLSITAWRRFIDAALCTSFTQSIILNETHPYVIGTRMQGDGLYITAMDTLVTDQGDWEFDAAGYWEVEAREEWGVIEPEEARDGRQVLKAAADAYLDWLADRSVRVPWAERCARLVGGAWYSDREGEGGNTCAVGVEGRVEVGDRRYVVDEEVGVVNVFAGIRGLDRNSSEPTPDSHTFRIEGGKIRYIHTLSTCEGHPGCGWNSTTSPIVRA